MAWFFLVLAGIFEIGFAICLKLSDGFAKWLPTGLFMIFACLSFWFLTRALQTIPIGTSYAIWTGIGAFGTAIIGMIFFSESTSPARMILLLVLIGSIIGLKLVSK